MRFRFTRHALRRALQRGLPLLAIQKAFHGWPERSQHDGTALREGWVEGHLVRVVFRREAKCYVVITVMEVGGP